MTANVETFNRPGHPFDGAPVISSYTRAQALEDGFLVEVPEKLWREAGFKWPVAITTHVYTDVARVPDHPKAQGESIEGRLWDILWMAYRAVLFVKQHGKPGDDDNHLPFDVLATDELGKKRAHRLWVVLSGEGPNGAPTLTIMFPEDN